MKKFSLNLSLIVIMSLLLGSCISERHGKPRSTGKTNEMLVVTNTKDMALHATITDTLPLSVTLNETSGGTLAIPGQTAVLPDGAVAVTWTAVITAPGGTWTGMVLVTVDEDYVGPLTNLVEVTTDEGAIGEASVTVSTGSTVYLPLVVRNESAR